VDLRVFLGSAGAVGVGSIGAVSAGGLLPASADVDGVYNEIVSQLTRAIARMQERPDGGAARQVGSALRLLAAWGRANGIDDMIKRSLNDSVRRQGRAAIIATPFDIGAELKMRGWLLPPRFEATATSVDIGDSLDDLRANGVTHHWTDYADAFESSAADLDRSSAVLTRAAQAPYNCSGAEFRLLMLQTQVALACSLGLAIGPEYCAIATALVIGWSWRMWWVGC
jgi:hypothetical protein